jgi:hypothetical protein
MRRMKLREVPILNPLLPLLPSVQILFSPSV